MLFGFHVAVLKNNCCVQPTKKTLEIDNNCIILIIYTSVKIKRKQLIKIPLTILRQKETNEMKISESINVSVVYELSAAAT